MKNAILICLIAILFCSCRKRDSSNDSQSITYDYNLVQVEKEKNFNLDDETRYNLFYLSTFEERGREYFSFLNYRTNQILFYNLDNCEYLFKIEMDKEGSNGIPLISGYYAAGFDNMYVSSYAMPGLAKIDTIERIVQKIIYGKTKEGYQIVPSYTPSSYPYIPPVIIGSKLFITQQAANHIYSVAQTPVSVLIDTLTNSSESLPFTFGDVLEDKHFTQDGESRFSRAFDGNHFIYSFYADEYIYVTSINHKDVRKIKAKSKYVDEIKFEKYPSEPNLRAKRNLEIARYGDLIYDKYRDVYYRFVYPETTLQKDKQYIGTAIFGRNLFSVIILDNQFNIVGETLFPRDIYNSYVFFLHKDGLYISSDYQMNFDKSENLLTFKLFELNKH